MLTEDTLKKYVTSIDWEISYISDRIISFNKYGLILGEESYQELNEHIGYRNTIQRYIENKDILTEKEILSILRLYPIDFPDRRSIDISDTKGILSYIPIPIIRTDLYGKSTIQFVPKVIIDSELEGKIVGLGSFAPSPIIRSESEGKIVGEDYFVPSPIIRSELEGKSVISFIPQPIIISEKATDAFPLDFAPAPMAVTEIDIPTEIEFIPQPIIEMKIEEITTGNYYWGFAGYTAYGDDDRREALVTDIDESFIDSIVGATSPSTHSYQGYLQEGEITEETDPNHLLAENWHKNLPSDTRVFNIFLIPSALNQRNTLDTPHGTADIGGELDTSSTGNPFPSFDKTVTYNGVEYYVYIGNVRRAHYGNFGLISKIVYLE